MDNQVVLAEFEKNANEMVQVRKSLFNGREIVDIRVYFKNEVGALVPTKKGVCVSRNKFNELLGAMNEAANKLGLSTEADPFDFPPEDPNARFTHELRKKCGRA